MTDCPLNPESVKAALCAFHGVPNDGSSWGVESCPIGAFNMIAAIRAYLAAEAERGWAMRQIEPPEPEYFGCGYQGCEFGASYPDSLCCDGFLWDADSCDEPGGALTQGGEIPCPQCNTEAFLADALREAMEGSCGESMLTPWCAATRWEYALRKAFRVNEPVAREWLGKVEPFTTCDWPDRDAVYAGRARWDHTIEHRWPWAFDAAAKDPAHD